VQDDARRRLRVVGVLAVPVVALAAVPALQLADWAWVSLCLALPVAAWGAAPFHRSAWRGLRRGTATTESLVSASVLAAVGWSLLLLSPGRAGTAVERDPFWTLPGPGLTPTAVHLYLGVAVLLTIAALAGRTWSPTGARPAPSGDAGAYAVAVVVLAGAAAGFWLTAAGPGRAVAAAAGVVVVACPVALVVAAPAAHARAARRARRLGIGVRRPGGLERATQVDTIVFAPVDLTGVRDAGGGDPVVEPSAAGAVARLRSLGLRTVLLTTGDPQGSLTLAGRVGIAEVFAEIGPRERVAVIRRLQNEGRVVAFVGDAGDVHDRAALAQADLGLRRPGARVGDAAVDESAATGDGDGDVTLISGGLWAATDTVRLGRATRRTTRANRALAFAGSVVALPVAAAGLLTPLVVLVAPALAGGAIVANSLRLRSFRSARPASHHRR
jgi:cation transport ATPase